MELREKQTREKERRISRRTLKALHEVDKKKRRKYVRK